MKINRRLTLLVAAPLAVAVTFSGLALAPAASQALQADRLADMVEAAAGAAELTEHLQHERVAATALVSGQGDLDTFRESSETTDRSVTRFRQGIADLSEVPQNAQVMLDRIERSVEKLVSLRAQARSGSSTISALAFGYRIVIADLIGYRDGIAQADGVDADIADRIRAAAALSEAAEYTAQEQVTVMRAQATGGFTTASRRTFDASRLGYTESIGALYGLGPGEWRTMLERTLSGEKALEARRLEDRISRTGVDQDIDVAPKEWIKASADRQELLRSVEKRVDASVHETVSAERTLLFWTAGGELVLVVLTLVGAVVVAFRLGRVMIRRLHGLRNAARGVAQTGLPAVMSELSQPGALRGATPEEVAKRTADPVEATGDDEIGEVGEAFNAVHHEAVRLAAQQAHIHAQFAETLVGVARRGAQLTSIMVSELDTVQRDEADPERMKTLFALDHLAVRMERNTNNILVLGVSGTAGCGPTMSTAPPSSWPRPSRSSASSGCRSASSRPMSASRRGRCTTWRTSSPRSSTTRPASRPPSRRSASPSGASASRPSCRSWTRAWASRRTAVPSTTPRCASRRRVSATSASWACTWWRGSPPGTASSWNCVTPPAPAPSPRSPCPRACWSRWSGTPPPPLGDRHPTRRGARRRPSPAGPPVGAPPVRVDRGGRARTRPGASPAPGGRAGRPDRRGQRVGSARPQAQRSAAVALGQQAREHRAAPRDDRPPQAAPPPRFPAGVRRSGGLRAGSQQEHDPPRSLHRRRQHRTEQVMNEPTELSWILQDFTGRVPEVTRAIAVSVDGLALAYAGLDRDEADRLAAIASGIVNLLSAAAQSTETDPVEHSLTAMEGGYMFSMAVSTGASLLVTTTRDADIGEVSYMMAELINQVGDSLSPQLRDPHTQLSS